MARYKSKIYAEALVNSFFGKADDKKIVNNFLKLLEKNQDLKKAREIIALAESLFLKKLGNKKIILETARKVDAKNLIKSFVKKGDIVEEKINSKLIAGIKIIVNNNKQLDFSLASKLNKII